MSTERKSMHIFNGTPSRGRIALNNAVSSATDNIFAAAGGWLLNLKNQNFKSTFRLRILQCWILHKLKIKIDVSFHVQIGKD